MKSTGTTILVDAREIRVGDTVNTFTHLAPRLATVVRVMPTTWKDMRGTSVPAVELLVRHVASERFENVTRIHGAQIWRVTL